VCVVEPVPKLISIFSLGEGKVEDWACAWALGKSLGRLTA